MWLGMLNSAAHDGQVAFAMTYLERFIDPSIWILAVPRYTRRCEGTTGFRLAWDRAEDKVVGIQGAFLPKSGCRQEEMAS
jgi:hypothetical protein